MRDQSKLIAFINKNDKNIGKLLLLARLRSKALKINNKVGALILDINSLEYCAGWNYSLASALEKHKSGEPATIYNLSLNYSEDDLITNHGAIVHAETHAIDNLKKLRSSSIDDLNMPMQTFEELKFSKEGDNYESSLNRFLSKLDTLIDDVESYLDDLKAIHKNVELFENTIKAVYVCIVTKEPCESCLGNLVQNNIDYLLWPVGENLFRAHELIADSYKDIELTFYIPMTLP